VDWSKVTAEGHPTRVGPALGTSELDGEVEGVALGASERDGALVGDFEGSELGDSEREGAAEGAKHTSLNSSGLLQRSSALPFSIGLAS